MVAWLFFLVACRGLYAPDKDSLVDSAASASETDTDTDTDSDSDADVDSDSDSDADTDTDTDVPCPSTEVCANGIDDDCNGLVDCEDATCVAAAHCSEQGACTDGQDNDLDGWVDCDDEDCWGAECHLDGVQVRRLGGELVYREQWFHSETHHFGSVKWTTHRVSGTALDVSGSVRVIPAGARWSTATSWTTCQFNVARAVFLGSEVKSWGPVSRTPIEVSRSGFYVETGCRLADDSFLPRVLRAPRGASPPNLSWTPPAGPGVWYGGSPAMGRRWGSTSRATMITSSYDPEQTMWGERATFMVDDMGLGGGGLPSEVRAWLPLPGFDT